MGKKKTTKQKDPDAWKEEGNIAFGQQNFNQAVKCYTQAIEGNPNNHVYFANRANAYIEVDKFSEAVEDCDKAISIDPKFFKSYLRKGNALFSLNKVPDALTAFEEGLKLEPDN